MNPADDQLGDDVIGLIHPALQTALAARGYDVLTAVQRAVLQHADTQSDLLVSAQTGSGKTVAFGIAIAGTILDNQPRFGPAQHPLALVIAPTRELALQVQRELDWLYAEAGVSTASSVGGMDIRTERRALARGAHIVVGTPGRLRDHITTGALDLSAIRAVVLDEADEMLDLGFSEDLEFILAAAPAERRTLMFSATIPPAIETLAKTFQRDAVRLTATAAAARHADIEYQMLLVHPQERDNAVINALLYFEGRNSIVFCHTREAVKHLTARLSNRGFAVVTLSGELSQAERTNALQAMRDGRARVCVATDVAARGLDLPNLDLVIHADMPSKPDTLLHRSGRTGRAGRKGICLLIVPIHRRSAASRVLKLANVEALTRAAPTLAEVEARTRRAILEGALKSSPIAEHEQPLVSELLASLSAEQIAALYLRQQMALRPSPEDTTEIPPAELQDRPSRRRTERQESGDRRPDMQGSTWFTISVGRKHRADPKWLLPVICKAGRVNKQDVGSIKIEQAETRFEISGDKAASFAQRLAQHGSGEKGITIAPLKATSARGPDRASSKSTPSGHPADRPKAAKRKTDSSSPAMFGEDGRSETLSRSPHRGKGKPSKRTPHRGDEGQQARKRPTGKAPQ